MKQISDVDAEKEPLGNFMVVQIALNVSHWLLTGTNTGYIRCVRDAGMTVALESVES